MRKQLDNKIKNRRIANNVISELQKEWKLFNLSNIKNHLLTQDQLEVYWCNKPFFDDSDFIDQLNRNTTTKKFIFISKREDFCILTDYICGSYIEGYHTATELLGTVYVFKQCVYDTVIVKSNYNSGTDFTSVINENAFENMIRNYLVYNIKDHLGLYNISVTYKEKINTIIDMIVSLNLNLKTYQEYVNSIRNMLTEESYNKLMDVTRSIYDFPNSIFDALSVSIPEKTFRTIFLKNPVFEYFFGPSILCDQVIKYSMVLSKLISKTGIGGHYLVLSKFMDKKIEDRIFEVTYSNIKKYYN